MTDEDDGLAEDDDDAVVLVVVSVMRLLGKLRVSWGSCGLTLLGCDVWVMSVCAEDTDDIDLGEMMAEIWLVTDALGPWEMTE